MKKLYDLDVAEVSLVPKGANKKKFLIFKSENGGAVMGESVRKLVTSVNPKTMAKVDKVLKGYAEQSPEKVVQKEKKQSDSDMLKKDAEQNALSDKAKLALKASARILAPHKDEISTDHLHQVANAIGIGGGPEDEGTPLEGSAGQSTPIQSDKPDSAGVQPRAAEPDSDEQPKIMAKEMGDILDKAFGQKDESADDSEAEEKEAGEEEELSGLEKDGQQAEEDDSGLTQKKHPSEMDDEDDEDEEDEESGLDEDDDDDLEKGYGSMSPEKVAAHKAGMAAYKQAVNSHVKKLGTRMYPDEKELMKSKDGESVEEEEVGKTSVSKSDSLDLTAVPQSVRPAVEHVFKSQKELVKKNAELQTQIEEMKKENRKKELIAKVDSWKHLTGKEELLNTLIELDSTSPKARELVEKQYDTLNAEKETVAKSLFTEIGSSLPGGKNDVEAKIDAAVNSIVQKSAGNTTKAAAYDLFIRTEDGQRLYGEFKNSRGGI